MRAWYIVSNNRPVNEPPFPVYSARKKCGVFVFWRHNRPEPVKMHKVICQRHGYQRTATRIRSVNDGPLVQFGKPRNPRVFNPPQFFWMVVRIRRQRRQFINLPVANPVFTDSLSKVGKSSSVLHPGKQQDFTMINGRPWIEHRIYWVRPVFSRQNRVMQIPQKKLFKGIVMACQLCLKFVSVNKNNLLS